MWSKGSAAGVTFDTGNTLGPMGDYCSLNFGEAEDELVGVNSMNELELSETIAHVCIEENKKECM